MFLFNAFTLYVFIVCIIFNLKYLLELIVNLKKEDPEQLEISTENKIYLLFTSSYVITYIIMLFSN